MWFKSFQEYCVLSRLRSFGAIFPALALQMRLYIFSQKYIHLSILQKKRERNLRLVTCKSYKFPWAPICKSGGFCCRKTGANRTQLIKVLSEQSLDGYL